MKQDDLYTLIQKMTKQEKIFFNRYAQVSNNKKNKHYLSLFKAIDSQFKKNGVIDEQSLKKKFQYLSVEKRYLLNVLIKALTVFHENDDGFVVVKTLIKQIKVLIDKGVFKEAKKLHTKAVDMAEQYNLFEDLLILNNLKMVMADYQTVINDLDEMQALTEDKKKCVDQMLNHDQYRLFIYRIYEFSRQHDYIDTPEKMEKLNALIDIPLLQSPDQALSNKAKELYFMAKICICFMLDDIESQYQEFQQRIALMDANPHLYDAYNKMIVTRTYIYCCVHVKEEEECRQQLQSLDRQVAAYPAESGFAFANLHLCHLVVNSGFGDFECNKEWISKAEVGLKTYKDISQLLKEFLYFALGRACMELEHYEKALDYLYKVNEDKVFGKDAINYTATRLLILICYYELGWQSNLESAVISFYRQIRRASIKFKLYELLLKYLKLAIANRDLTHKKTLQFFSTEWKSIESNSREMIPFHFFHYKEWLQSKVEKKPLSAYFKNVTI